MRFRRPGLIADATGRERCKMIPAALGDRNRRLTGTSDGLIKTFKAMLASPSESAIPARVWTEIERREQIAERLIGWVQLALLAVFSTVYFIGGPIIAGGSGANFTPVALALYLVFTVFRLWLSYRITLPTWFLVLSILADITLLCAMIFSLHLQYNQPPSFYLKAPNMIYMFVFIGVRALRFDPRFVLITGLASTLGWFILVTYAIMSEQSDMYITTNMVEYLTANSIFIDVEITKMLSLFGVTLVLSLALVRARAALVNAVHGNAAASDLRQFFDPAVAETITASEDLPMAGRSETREVSVLIVDLRSFTTSAAGLPPETVLKVLGLYQQAAVGEIERHRGQIDKFMGDGILATFGAVEESPTHAADALRTAVALIGAIDAVAPQVRAAGWAGPFRACCAVASGPATVGVVGARNRLEFTVIGTPVNLAAKLEAANKIEASRALTESRTYHRAVAQGFAGKVAAFRRGRQIPGFTGALDLVVLA